ncbi:helix-turn-helix transcriptional regulator [Actinomadura meridiana]|uniref:Helix-turn-helix transcriptional regulator n=1 Tax=Actinomadura meridiana TaxID=559626 RepID=A0ABP8C9K6_9ACTN
MQQARKALADELRELLKRSGSSGAELARHAGWDVSKPSKILTLVTSPSVDDIRIWCAYCGAPGRADDLIQKMLSVSSAYIEWRRRERAGLRSIQDSYVPLWERTERFRIYETSVIPGLLQTEGYAAAMLRTIIAFKNLRNDLPEAVAARLDRQRVLRSGARTFVFLIEEAALRVGFGGPGVMREQLDHLSAVTEWPNVLVGIIPFSTDRTGRLWVPKSFWIYDAERVITELLTAEVTVAQRSEIETYERAFDVLADLAVFGHESRVLIRVASERYS